MPRAILSHVEADFIQPLWRVARWSAVAALLCGAASAQKPVNQPLQPERRIEPTFLRRHIPDVPAKSLDVSTESCRYKPLFGAGDSDSAVPRGVARFGELTLSPGGNCKAVTLESEEQVYVIIDGAGLLRYGADSAAVRRHDFLYLPAGVERSLSSSPAGPMRLFVMGFKLPEKAAPYYKRAVALKPDNANIRMKLIDTYAATYLFQNALQLLDSLYARKEINFSKQLMLAEYDLHSGRFSKADTLLN